MTSRSIALTALGTLTSHTSCHFAWIFGDHAREPVNTLALVFAGLLWRWNVSEHICDAEAKLKLRHGAAWRQINLVGLNRHGGGGYGDCKRAGTGVNRLGWQCGCAIRCTQAISAYKSGCEVRERARANGCMAQSVRNGRAHSWRGPPPRARGGNRECIRSFTVVPEDAARAAARVQSALWARTGHGRSAGNAGAGVGLCGA